MDQSKISRCVDILCEKGCTEVLSLIQRLELGTPVAETSDLDEEERQCLLQELKSIMAVYERKLP